MENEYDTIREAYRFGAAERYIRWAADMAVGQKTGVPWLMCKQKDAPGEVVILFFSLNMFLLYPFGKVTIIWNEKI